MAPNLHAVVSHMTLDRAHSRRTNNGPLRCSAPPYWTASNRRGAMTASRVSKIYTFYTEIIHSESTRLHVVPKAYSHLKDSRAVVDERKAQLHRGDVDRRYDHSEVGCSHPCKCPSRGLPTKEDLPCLGQHREVACDIAVLVSCLWNSADMSEKFHECSLILAS